VAMPRVAVAAEMLNPPVTDRIISLVGE